MRAVHTMTVVGAVVAWLLLSMSAASSYDIMAGQELGQITGAHKIYECKEEDCGSGEQHCCLLEFANCDDMGCPAQFNDCQSRVIHMIGRCHMGTKLEHCSDEAYTVKCQTMKGGNVNPGGTTCGCTRLCGQTFDQGCWGTE